MTTPQTNAQRQQALTERRKAAGLKQVRNLWVPADDEEKVRAYVAKLVRAWERSKR